jgi:hypothetical protein
MTFIVKRKKKADFLIQKAINILKTIIFHKSSQETTLTINEKNTQNLQEDASFGSKKSTTQTT